jgi:predicted RND superfamily exporter protein
MQFGSFTAPVPVMMSLPLSLIGVVLALLATGGTLNLMSFIGVIMLMGLVAKNAILLLDCARKEEAQGVDREEALMHAGRVRLRPILMTTFALIAGMTPIAIGLGEGGEFYRPMAVAIIGGVITSTVLTLLVIPSFYDSIEIARERAVLKARARAALTNPAVAFAVTFAEALFALTMLRALYRAARWLVRLAPVEHPVHRAARLTGFEVPAGFEAHRGGARQRRRSVTVAPGGAPAGTGA